MSKLRASSGIIKIQNYLKKIKTPAKASFVVIGILSTIWFLVRVVPKPQRAGYPCMKAAAPWASAFIIYLIALSASVFSFGKFRKFLKISKYQIAFSFLVLSIVFAVLTIPATPGSIKAETLADPLLGPNEPIGQAKGIIPGRVVWVYNPEATDETCTNTAGDYWFQNTNQEVVSEMLDDAILNIAGVSDIGIAWDSIFRYFNRNHDKGDLSYTSGEKIYIKINLTTSCCGGWNNQTEKAGWLDHMDATPEVCLALLKQLVENVGVAQSDIYLGDPFRRFHDIYWDYLHSVYPDVHYMDGDGYNGRQQTTLTTEDLLIFSDGVEASRLPQEYVDASYFINMPCLKTHNEGAITLAAKNHQGSYIQDDGIASNQSAQDMHYSLPANNEGHGKYRHLVDYMSHEHLGGKTLLYIIDGIWSGRNWEGIVEKWEMTPFNGDYTSSLFVSQDPVAIESVCYDFLLEEYKTKSASIQYPYIDGADDYLLQAADNSYWPDGIEYDPENDGSVIGSLGTHEHWNNADDKQYSRNLETGSGIELVKLISSSNSYPSEITTENSELPSNKVNAIYVDSSNTVWIGTDAGVSSLNETGWKHFDTVLLNSFVNDIAYEYSTTYGKELWVATDSGLTVAAYNDVDGITSATTYIPVNSLMVGSKVAAVAVDQHHNRWVGTDSALSVFKGNTWNSILTGIDSQEEDFNFYEYNISDIDIYTKDTVALITTEGKGIVRYEYNEIDGFTGASTYGSPWSAVTSDNFYAIDVDDTTQWYGTDVGAYFHPSVETKGDWILYDVDGESLINNTVNTVLVDQDKNAWLGTPSGISIVLPDGGVFNLTKSEGLINNSVNYITSDIQGYVWVATNGGVQWFDGISGNQVALGIPQLISPEFQSENISVNPTLTWSSISGASGYTVQLAVDRDFETLVVNESGISSVSYSPPTLADQSSFYWRVAATNSTLTGDWSATYKFTTKDGVGLDNTDISKSVLLYPNPATDFIIIDFVIIKAQQISVSIYNSSGSLISIPVNSHFDKGKHSNTIKTPASDGYGPGMYFIQIKGESFTIIRKINIL
ncbi:MAG: DUF362 domain-containing protein [Bacteroidales bacterium]|nr:DUF362 domain-containing protein [Bacteroidales bacterium]MBN2819350.1 DUF362 domain-containing protein [Bacteroidales bacterium]